MTPAEKCLEELDRGKCSGMLMVGKDKFIEVVDRHIAAAAAEEREACAKVASVAWGERDDETNRIEAALCDEIAAAIRKRGQP